MVALPVPVSVDGGMGGMTDGLLAKMAKDLVYSG